MLDLLAGWYDFAEDNDKNYSAEVFQLYQDFAAKFWNVKPTKKDFKIYFEKILAILERE